MAYDKRVPNDCLGDIYYGFSGENDIHMVDGQHVLRNICVVYECVDSAYNVKDEVLSVETQLNAPSISQEMLTVVARAYSRKRITKRGTGLLRTTDDLSTRTQTLVKKRTVKIPRFNRSVSPDEQ